MIKNTEYIFINQVTGPLFIDIINDFSEKGLSITLLTGEIQSISQVLHHNVKIKKLIRYERKTNTHRVLTWSIFLFQVLFFLILQKRNKTQLFLVSNPPFLPYINLLFGFQSNILIYDVYPDILETQKIIKPGSGLYKVLKQLNILSFKKAQNVFTITEGMRKAVSSYCESKKISVVECWADTEQIRPIPKEQNSFIKKHDLSNKFIVMYSGNLGLSHDIESIMECAKILNSDMEICFVVIGEGVKKKYIENFIQENKISNVISLPLQKPEIIPQSMASADLAIISQGKGISNLSIPSKTFYFMASGSCLLAIADQESDLYDIIHRHNLGKTVSSGDIDSMVNFIKFCKENPNELNNFKIQSRLTSRFYTRENSTLFFKHMQQSK